MKLTRFELTLLRALLYFSDGWARPMDIGGHDGSRHSAVLKKLCARGLVERRARHTLSNVIARACKIRPSSYEYKITDAGRAEVAKNKER